jgi:proline dehydrogenase
MAYEKILSDIELRENTTNENTFEVWFDKADKTFLARENNGVRSYLYRLKDDVENITKQHRNEILEYRLGRVTKHDEVTIADIFMHGNFIDRLN